MMLDLPEIKKRCEADPTVVFSGDEVLLLVEALEEAQKALEKYGIHLTDCKWSGAEPSDCTCGLDRILKGE